MLFTYNVFGNASHMLLTLRLVNSPSSSFDQSCGVTVKILKTKHTLNWLWHCVWFLLSDINTVSVSVWAWYFRIYIQPVRVTKIPASKLTANWGEEPLHHNVITSWMLFKAMALAGWLPIIVFVVTEWCWDWKFERNISYVVFVFNSHFMGLFLDMAKSCFILVLILCWGIRIYCGVASVHSLR